MCNQARHQITHRRSISLAHRWVDFSFAATAAGWEVWHWIWGRAQVLAPSIWVYVVFLLLFPWSPVNRLRIEKRKRKLKERTLLGQLGFSYRAGLENSEFWWCTTHLDLISEYLLIRSSLVVFITRCCFFRFHDFDQNLLFFFLDFWHVRVRGGLLRFRWILKNSRQLWHSWRDGFFRIFSWSATVWSEFIVFSPQFLVCYG